MNSQYEQTFAKMKEGALMIGKTVQEFLREADSDRLISEYCYKYPVDIFQLDADECTIGEIKRSIREKLKNYIERLRAIETASHSDGRHYVFFANKHLDEEYGGIECSLICMEELEEKPIEQIESYSYILERQEEIMGTIIAETDLSKAYIIKLLVDIMYEASWFGFENEHLEKERQGLNEAIREVKEGRTVEFDLDEFVEKYGLESEFKEPVDEKEEQLRHDALKAGYTYSQYSFMKELRKVKQLMSADSDNVGV